MVGHKCAIAVVFVWLFSVVGPATAQPEQPSPTPPPASIRAPRSAPSQSPGAPSDAGEKVVDASAADAQLDRFLARAVDARGRPCDLQAVVARANLRYLACGRAGLWIVRASEVGALSALDQADLHGFVAGFFEHNGQLWLEMRSVSAYPVADLIAGRDADAAVIAGESLSSSQAPSPPSASGSALLRSPPPPRSTSGPRPTPEGRVVGVGPGYVQVSLGLQDGVASGAHVAFYEDREVDVGASHSGRRSHLIAVGRVDTAATERSRVDLGIDEHVPHGSRAVVTDRPLTTSRVAPPRPTGLWEVGFMSRLFLALENIGGGVIADLYAGRRFEAPFHLQARVAPLSVASADQGTVTPFSVYALASFDTRLFEAGLGLGAESVNLANFDLEPGSGVGLIQFVRLGSVDGLNVTAYSHVVLFHSEFTFSSLRLAGQVPLTDGTWLILGGGGGAIGMAYGEIGLRALIWGNGTEPSFLLSGVVGGAAAFEEHPCTNFDFDGQCPDSPDYFGPMGGVGGEWRF